VGGSAFSRAGETVACSTDTRRIRCSGHKRDLSDPSPDTVGRVQRFQGAIAQTIFALSAQAPTPIVFAVGSDPVAAGLVTGLSRPGGNATGASFFATELGTKRFEPLRVGTPGDNNCLAGGSEYSGQRVGAGKCIYEVGTSRRAAKHYHR
jgi:hypothetical protein